MTSRGKIPPSQQAADASTVTDKEAARIFEQFGELFPEIFDASQRRCPDLQVELRISAERALHGGAETVEVPTKECNACRVEVCSACEGRGSFQQQRGFFMVATTCSECVAGSRRDPECSRCHGVGLVNESREVVVPVGAESGHVIVVKQAGPTVGDRRGDLYVHIVVERANIPQATLVGARPSLLPVAIVIGGLFVIGALWSVLM